MWNDEAPGACVYFLDSPQNLCYSTHMWKIKIPAGLIISFVLLHFSAAQEYEPVVYFDRAPYLQSLTKDSVIIVSQTEEKSVAQLVFSQGIDDQLMHETEASHDHVFHIDRLTPNTEYAYRLNHGNGRSFEASFKTLPEPGTAVTIAAFGDCGYYHPPGDEHAIEDQKRIAVLLEGITPKIPLILQTGDLVTSATMFNYVQYACFDIYEDLLSRCCMYPVLGNHDFFIYIEPWLTIFHTPANNQECDERYYSFDVGDAHIACVDSFSLNERQCSWLMDDLSKTNQIWKIISLHKPPYGTVRHYGDDDVQKMVMPIADAFHVDMVLTGHNHVYERFYPLYDNKVRDSGMDPHYHWPGGTVVVTTGGGGAPLYTRKADANVANTPDLAFSAKYESVHHFLTIDITPEKLEVVATRANGDALDRFSISKQGEKPPTHFIRGDANENGAVDLSDAIVILNYLFHSKDAEPATVPPCMAACDANHSGGISLADPVFLLSYLFANGPVMEAPFPDCGAVTGIDDVGCGQCVPD